MVVESSKLLTDLKLVNIFKMSVDFVKFLFRGNHFVRCMSAVSVGNIKPVFEPDNNMMQAWQINKFGNISELKLTSVNKPTIKKPSEVLVKVLASSVNPIDVAMLGTKFFLILHTLYE